MAIYYPSGEEIHAGDELGPGKDWDGQTARVVVVIPTSEAVPGFAGSQWAYLETGVVVEHINPSGTFLVYYRAIDEDFQLLRRAQ